MKLTIKPGEGKIFEGESFEMTVEENGDFTINTENNARPLAKD